LAGFVFIYEFDMKAQRLVDYPRSIGRYLQREVSKSSTTDVIGRVILNAIVVH